jgi:predicted ester cyclase
MTIEDNKRIIREAIEAESAHDFDRTFEAIDDACVFYQAGAEPITGSAQARPLLDGMLVVMPDFHREIQELVAEGDMVVARTKIGGTLSGQAVAWDNCNLYRMRDGKCVEMWIFHVLPPEIAAVLAGG